MVSWLSGETFLGSDWRSWVFYYWSNLRVVVIHLVTGEELLNCIYGGVDEGYF